MSQKLHRTLERRQHGGITSIAAKARSAGGASVVAGNASSISFTPIHGLEIVAPISKQESASGMASVYFNSATNFLAPTKPAVKKQPKNE